MRDARYSLLDRVNFRLLVNLTTVVKDQDPDMILWKELEKQRYLYSRVFVSKSNWASSVLSQLFIDRFREYVRMNRESLNHIVKLIRHDSVFQNEFTNLQTLVENQILFALYRLEHDDNVNEFLTFAIMWEMFEEYFVER